MTGKQFSRSNRAHHELTLNAIIAAIYAVVIGAGVLQCSMPLMLKPSQESINRYQQAHPDLPAPDKKCIDEGHFEIGIQQGTLIFLLGKPDVVDTVKREWAVQQHWTYKRGGKKTFIMEEQHVVGILLTK